MHTSEHSHPNRTAAFAAIASLCAVTAWQAFAAADVVVDGSWTIVYQSGMEDSRGVRSAMQQAAVTLADVLHESLGVKVAVASEEKAPAASGRRLIIGGRLAEKAGVMPPDFNGWDWGIAERGGDLYFYGRDRGGAHKEWPSGCVVPSALAAVQFMKQNVGALFLMPGKVGREVPRRERLSVPEGYSRRGSVKADYQTGRGADFIYNLANGIYGSGAYHTYGGHTYPVACPRKKYFKDHPEYFGMDKEGKRHWGGSDGCQANCISNPEFQKLLYDELLRRYDAGADSCQLAQNDGSSVCHCEACRKFYGEDRDWGEKLWLFHRDIAERIRKDRPGRLVHIMCYGDTANPPQSFKVFPDNVMIEVCSYGEENMKRWQGYTVPHGFTYYIYNWSWYPLLGFTPKRSIAGLVEQVKRFHRYGMKGIYRCGYGEMFGMEGPAYWVYNHLVENPEVDVPRALRLYYRAAFGPAAIPMQRFYEELEAPLAEVEKMNSTKMTDLVESTVKRPKKRDPLVALATVYTPERVLRMDRDLKEAQKVPGLSEKHVRRLQLVRTEWNYVRNIGLIAYRYNEFLAHPTKAGCDVVLDLVDERNEMIGRLFPEGRVRGVKGWPELSLFGSPPLEQFRENGRLGAKIGVPLTWDTVRMRRYRIVPGELMSPEERAAEMSAAGLRPLAGFKPVDDGKHGSFFESFADGTGFRFGQGTNKHVRVKLTVGAKQGVLPGKTYRISWLSRWEHVNALRSWNGFYFDAGFAPWRKGDWRDYSVRVPSDVLHYGTSMGWTRESAVMKVCDKPGFSSELTFRFWGGSDGIAEVRDLTIEALPE